MLNYAKRLKLVSMFLLLAGILCCPFAYSQFNQIPAGLGKVQFNIDSIAQTTLKGACYLPDRVEIWLGNRRIASLAVNSSAVTESRGSRLFSFEPIELEAGYYFLGIRLCRKGAIHGREKSRIYPVQVGIHSGKMSIINKQIQFFVW